MIRLAVVCLSTLVLCVSAGVAASETALTLPVLPSAGSSLEDLDHSAHRCEAVGTSVECVRAVDGAERVGGERVHEIVHVYRGGILVRSVVTFDETRFEAVATSLSVSLGTASQGAEALNAGMGGSFENRYYVWRRAGQAWLLEQFFRRIRTSGLWILSENELDALIGERERMRVRGVRNL